MTSPGEPAPASGTPALSIGSLSERKTQTSAHTNETLIPDGPGSQLDSTTQEPPLPLKKSLGLSGSLGIIGGSIGLLLVWGFLAFLWLGHGSAAEAANATRAWRQIALHDWMTRSITLSSLALRLAVSLQTTVCTSMLAALFLERRHTRISQVAWLSVMRSINDGPLRLVQKTLPPSPKSLSGILRRVEFWLLLLMVVITLALQFSSTILISDLVDFGVVSDVNVTEIPDLLQPEKVETILFDISPILGAPPIYATFGEVQSQSDASPNAQGLSFTGLLQRGLLPFSNEGDRTSLRQFNGNAVVVNSNVACMRPLISGRFYRTRGYGDTMTFGFVEGQLQYESGLQAAGIDTQALCDGADCQEVSFNCTIPGSSDYSWQSSLCVVGGVGGHILNSSSGFDGARSWNSSDEPWSRSSPINLVISSNMGDPEWANFDSYHPLPVGNIYNEWLSYETSPGRLFNISLCFVGANLERHYVSMTATKALQEPTADWSYTNTAHNTTRVQVFMGVGPQTSRGDRGVLDMKILGGPDDAGSAYTMVNHSVFSADGVPSSMTTANLTIAAMEAMFLGELGATYLRLPSILTCAFCSGYGQTPNPEVGLLLGDIIVQRGAAYALETWITIIGSITYRSYLSSLTLQQSAHIRAVAGVSAPRSCSAYGCPGFISVRIFLGIHMVYVAIITILYAKKIRYSRYANIWHSVSHLNSEFLTSVLESANDESDKFIKDALRQENGDDLVKLGRLEEGRRISIVKYEAKQKAI
ncbi:hypothetical protein Hte_007005 [Hypoxylon texense]